MHSTEWDQKTMGELEAEERRLAAGLRALNEERFNGGARNGAAAKRLREQERVMDRDLHEVRQAMKRKEQA